jgi:hypothetical protein
MKLSQGVANTRHSRIIRIVSYSIPFSIDNRKRKMDYQLEYRFRERVHTARLRRYQVSHKTDRASVNEAANARPFSVVARFRLWKTLSRSPNTSERTPPEFPIQSPISPSWSSLTLFLPKIVMPVRHLADQGVIDIGNLEGLALLWNLQPFEDLPDALRPGLLRSIESLRGKKPPVTRQFFS